MSTPKKWKVLGKFKIGALREQSSKFKVNDLVDILLENRGLRTKKEIDEFLNPKLESVTIDSVGINKKQLKKALARIKRAIEKKEEVVVFGDYDVDGICGTAILWETLNSLGAKVLPYIPHRTNEGYGLSETGISNVKSQILNVKLIITVDNGIVAHEAVEFANEQGIDVIITDHHIPAKKLPKAFAIVHTTKLCGAGVAYLLARECHSEAQPKNLKRSFTNVQDDNRVENHLELVALATIADLVPLVGANRTLTKFGLEKLQKTKRPGLIELFREAVLIPEEIGVYEIGHIIAPRLNAMGRLEYAMDSLRLLCTKDQKRAQGLAHKLGFTNRERQKLTEEAALHAISGIGRQESGIRKLFFVAHESYQQGVIGLVASRIVEEFYRPTIVVSKGDKYSKASARSVTGFNIIEFIRSESELLVDAGGHPMAAGFTVETTKLILLQERLEKAAEKLLKTDLLTRTLRIDCELPLTNINEALYDAICALSPFGMGNPEPTFLIKQLIITDMRLVGNQNRHLKLTVRYKKSDLSISAIGFGLGDRSGQFHIGDSVDIVCTIDENKWNGTKKLQLKVKDLRLS